MMILIKIVYEIYVVTYYIKIPFKIIQIINKNNFFLVFVFYNLRFFNMRINK